MEQRMLEGQVALVTGGASGIGRAIAERMSLEGAKVAILDFFADRAEVVAGDLSGGGADAIGMGGDVRASVSLDTAVATTVERFGRLDVMVNNAGVWDLSTACTDVSDELWANVLAVNLSGCFYGIRAALRVMGPQGSGAIVNIASSAALGGARAGTAYTASKAGVVGLTRQTAMEGAPVGVRVNAIAMGVAPSSLASNSAAVLDTGPLPFTDEDIAAQQAAAVEGMVPLARMAEPGEIAAGAVWLASAQASYVTGTVLEIDGGWSAK